MNKDIKTYQYDCGIIIGRFQIDELHTAHKQLIETVINNHSHVVIVLGLSPIECSQKNPLDYRTRKVLLQTAYPNVDIVYLNDMRYNDDWSDALDKVIQSVTRSHQSICLYGGRDSFIPYYSGKYQTQELTLKESAFISATSRRKLIRNTIVNDADFRKGIIYATASIQPMAFPAISLAIYDTSYNHILLGKTVTDRQYNFITDYLPIKKTFENFAVEVCFNKTGLKIDKKNLKKQDSYIIDDWRYRSENDSVITQLYTTTVNFGQVEPKGDLVMLTWIKLSDILEYISAEHYEMAHFLYKCQY